MRVLLLQLYLLLLVLLHSALLCAASDSVFRLGEAQSAVQGKIKFGTGMIGFQDMAVPLLYSRSFQARLRSDGLVPADNMDDLYGVAAMFALGVSYQRNAYTLGYRLSYYNIAGLINQTDARAASYSSVNSDLTAAYLLTPKVKVGVGVVAKRNIFSNIAQGHTILSLAPLAEFTVIATPDTTLRGYADYSMLARLGRYQDAELLGRRFHDANIKSSSLGFEIEHLLTDTAILSVVIEQSLTKVNVPDVGVHAGIPLVNRIPSPRILSLQTRVFSVGLVRVLGN